ncbi:FdhF/YdeP family oxidoreductase [Halalkalibaculum sp. DA384]|uniref:FdhF/YdeP family oxidoreductase n=1 Tax=Halalkalibaculum sp. DA384 TaxID=3373606 RepID=UPI0037543F9C
MEKKRKVEIKKIKDTAVGFPAIKSTGSRVLENMKLKEGLQTLFKLNQVEGCDCPSCAWPDPDPDDRSKIAEYCENGAKAIAWEATRKTIGPAFFEEYSVEELREKSNHWLEKQGRLTTPMVLREGAAHYEEISWKRAFELMAEQLNSLDSPDEAIFYTSGRSSNEAAFMYQNFVRQFGTNNLPDCSNMCHEASGKALGETTGIGKASVTLNDIQEADVLMIIGQNPGTNAPRMLTELQKLKKNGGKIIAVNPMPEAGFMGFRHPQKPWEWLGKPTKLQDLYLQVEINGDVALMKAIIKILHEEDKKSGGTIFDHDFIRNHTDGYDELMASLENESLAALIKASGVSADKVHEAAAMIRDNKKIIIAWAMGITQHKNGEDTIREFVNLLLLKGSIGKTGAGTLPVRGHSNVQGDRTMGIWEQMPDAFLDRLGKAFDFDPPRKHGVAAVDAVKAMAENKAKFFLGLGGNFTLATPDTNLVFEAMQKCELTAHISTKLNRSHVVHGKQALILPCLGRTEIDETSRGRQFVTTEDTAGRIRMSQGNLEPASEHLKSEPSIICGLAEATLNGKSNTDWAAYAEDYNLIRDKIEEVIDGFEDYNTRIQQPGGFYLPNGAREGRFETDNGKAHLTVNPVPNNEIAPGHFILMTMRSHDQFNTTIYGYSDRYRGIENSREVIMMNRNDMEELGLEAKDYVDITSYFNGEERSITDFQVVPYDISEGCIGMYFPEGNVLVAIDNKSPESLCPSSKFVEVSIQPSAS